VHVISDIRQIEIHIVEPLDHSPFVDDITIAKLKKYQSPGSDKIRAQLIQAGGEIIPCEIHKLIHPI
jgi:hypothetical protein